MHISTTAPASCVNLHTKTSFKSISTLKFAAVTQSGPFIINTVDLQSHNTKVFLWGMILTAGGTWGDGVGVLKRCDRGHPMRLLQPRVTMATVSLLHGAEWFLPVDTPKTHGAEGRAEMRRVQKEGSRTEKNVWRQQMLQLPYPSSAPVIMCSSFISCTQSMEPLYDNTILIFLCTQEVCNSEIKIILYQSIQ